MHMRFFLPLFIDACAGVLYNKGINYELDIWGEDMKHDWPTWRAMLPYYIESRF